jgi:hypothetical protein
MQMSASPSHTSRWKEDWEELLVRLFSFPVSRLVWISCFVGYRAKVPSAQSSKLEIRSTLPLLGRLPAHGLVLRATLLNRIIRLSSTTPSASSSFRRPLLTFRRHSCFSRYTQCYVPPATHGHPISEGSAMTASRSFSQESMAFTKELEARLQTLPLLQKLRSMPDAGEWYEARPYQAFPEERRVNNLTAGALGDRGNWRYTL